MTGIVTFVEYRINILHWWGISGNWSTVLIDIFIPTLRSFLMGQYTNEISRWVEHWGSCGRS
jgi:hypothetical protein